jgi:hypothetical protein
MHPADQRECDAGQGHNDLSLSSLQSSLVVTGTYTVGSSRQGDLDESGDGATSRYSMYLDLDGNGGGVVRSDDADDVFSAEAFQQQTDAFSAASLNGKYGLNPACRPRPAVGNRRLGMLRERRCRWRTREWTMWRVLQIPMGRRLTLRRQDRSRQQPMGYSRER